MAKKIQLMIIDPQSSFCKKVDPAEQQVIHDGELCVPGAWEDMERLATFIEKGGKILDDIKITLDSHHAFHIAHPMWFVNAQTGARPDPFTTMRYENDKIIGGTFNPDGSITDIGEFRTVRQGLMKWTTDYLKSLATGGRYPHMIWPYHCLIGTPGYNIVAPLFNVILDWETSNVAQATLLTKGSNFKTEHFSAVRAEVTDPEDQMTQLNTDFIGLFSEADEILLAGEARSHCLANTVRDMAEYFTDDSFIKKCVLLTDATSDVGGLEHLGEQFVSDMKAKGMQVTTTVDYLA